MVGRATLLFVWREQLVIRAGATTPATPAIAAVPRKLRREILDFVMLVGFMRNDIIMVKIGFVSYSNVNIEYEISK